MAIFFFFSSRRRHTRFDCDWSSDVCSSDLLEVIEVLDRDTALEALTHLAHVVLEALERGDVSLVDLDGVAHDAHARLPVDDPAADDAAGDRADLRDLEHLAHLRVADDDFAL